MPSLTVIFVIPIRKIFTKLQFFCLHRNQLTVNQETVLQQFQTSTETNVVFILIICDGEDCSAFILTWIIACSSQAGEGVSQLPGTGQLHAHSLPVVIARLKLGLASHLRKEEKIIEKFSPTIKSAYLKMSDTFSVNLQLNC